MASEPKHASTPYDHHISSAALAFQRYLGAVPTCASTGDPELADREVGEMHAHLEAAREIREQAAE